MEKQKTSNQKKKKKTPNKIYKTRQKQKKQLNTNFYKNV